MSNTVSAAPLNPSQEDKEALPMMVHVIAPASLPAGYTFEAEINGDNQKTFTCEVVSYMKYNYLEVARCIMPHLRVLSIFYSPEEVLKRGKSFLFRFLTTTLVND